MFSTYRFVSSISVLPSRQKKDSGLAYPISNFHHLGLGKFEACIELVFIVVFFRVSGERW